MAYWRLHYHLAGHVHRHSLISDERARIIEQTLNCKARELGTYLHQVGASEDHIHVVGRSAPYGGGGLRSALQGSQLVPVNTCACSSPGSAGRMVTGPLRLAYSLGLVIDTSATAQHHDAGSLIAAWSDANHRCRSRPAHKLGSTRRCCCPPPSGGSEKLLNPRVDEHSDQSSVIVTKATRGYQRRPENSSPSVGFQRLSRGL